MSRGVATLVCAVLLLSAIAPAAAAVAVPTQPSLGSAPAATQSGGSISLTVSDGDDAIAGAAVTVSRDGSTVLQGETGPNGTLDTGPLEDGTYTVTVTEPGYYERSISVEVEGSEVERSVTLEPGSVDLTVEVVDERTDEPLADATVEVEGVGTVRTAGDGTQTVRVPVNSEVGVVVSKEGYETAAVSVVVAESAESLTVSTTKETELTLSLAREEVPAGSTVEATVTDAYGDPVAGASILVDGEVVAQTDGDGTAAVPIDTQGEHDVRARASGVLSNQVAVRGTQPEETATPTEAATGNETDAGDDTDPGTATASPVPTATSGNGTDTGDEPISGLPLPEIGNTDGPLGVLPPFEGPIRIITVIGIVGLVGLLYSVFGSRKI